MNLSHFEALAAELKRTRPRVTGIEGVLATQVWKNCVIAIANVCEKSNISFDRDKFYKACGFDG